MAGSRRRCAGRNGGQIGRLGGISREGGGLSHRLTGGKQIDDSCARSPEPFAINRLCGIGADPGLPASACFRSSIEIICEAHSGARLHFDQPERSLPLVTGTAPAAHASLSSISIALGSCGLPDRAHVRTPTCAVQQFVTPAVDFALPTLRFNEGRPVRFNEGTTTGSHPL